MRFCRTLILSARTFENISAGSQTGSQLKPWNSGPEPQNFGTWTRAVPETSRSVDFDCVVRALPPFFLYPQKRKPNRAVLFRQRQIDEMNIQTSWDGTCIDRMQPVIVCPMQKEGRTGLYAKSGTDADLCYLTIEFPYFNRRHLSFASHVAIVCPLNQIIVLA